jgi:Transposase DDE domain group 1
VRERRADDSCADRSCGHVPCWIEEAHVTELTGLLRGGPGGGQLAGWPASMRVFARRERPHPGWRYSLWVTNLPASLRGWRAQPAYIDAAHRVHARVEDRIRTGKDCGIGRFPSHNFAINSAWLAASLIAATLLAWLALLALDGDLAPRRAEDHPQPGTARRGPADPRRTPTPAENPP